MAKYSSKKGYYKYNRKAWKKYKNSWWRYRGNRQLQYAKNLNYYTTKVTFQGSLDYTFNSTTSLITGYRWQVGQYAAQSSYLNFGNFVRNWTSYSNIATIYSNVKLLGCSVKAWLFNNYDAATNIKRVNWGSFTITFGENSNASGNSRQNMYLPLELNKVVSHYFKNYNRDWYESALSAAQMDSHMLNFGSLCIYNDRQEAWGQVIEYQQAPKWNINITIYVKFRKNVKI